MDLNKARLLKLVLFFLSLTHIFFTDNVSAEECFGRSSAFALSPDIGFGQKYKISQPNNFKTYGACVAEKARGEPVRMGVKSLRFEVKNGDCGWSDEWNDCDTDRARHELSAQDSDDGELWYAWSIFVPKNTTNIFPAKLAMGQFHQRGTTNPAWMFQNAGGGYHIDNQVFGNTRYLKELLTSEQLISKWNDVLIHVN